MNHVYSINIWKHPLPLLSYSLPKKKFSCHVIIFFSLSFFYNFTEVKSKGTREEMNGMDGLKSKAPPKHVPFHLMSVASPMQVRLPI